MSSKILEIQDLLCKKAQTKQDVYRITQSTFNQLKQVMQNIVVELTPKLAPEAPNVEVKYSDNGLFEAHLKFGGDTMVIMMHSNIFDFEEAHYLNKTTYMQEDKMREFCGMIQIYNFLSDSIKYNRDNDFGYLIARMFINKDNHFFVEGKRPLSFLFPDISKNSISTDVLKTIIEEAMLFCLHFDLLAPPIDSVNYISVEQKNTMSNSSGMPTGKRLGFVMSKDDKNLDV